MVRRVARPRKEIDKEAFEKLCALQCTKDEICAWFKIDEKTLTAWCKREYKEGFSDVYKKKRCVGKISLRRYQWNLAKKNAGMAIWLGKQVLNQTETGEQNAENENGREDELSKSLREFAEGLESDEIC